MTRRPPILIAISGGSGSGKTTLATALANRLGHANCLVISEDDYYRGQPEGVAFDPDRFNFDDMAAKEMDLLGRHLEQLREGQVVERPKYDLRTHKRLPQTVAMAPAEYIIVEGIHCLSTDYAALFDLRIYVDTPDDIRLARRVLRDISQRGRPVEEVVHRYVEFVRPAHYSFTEAGRAGAHVVIRDESFSIAHSELDALNAMDALLDPAMARLRALGED